MLNCSRRRAVSWHAAPASEENFQALAFAAASTSYYALFHFLLDEVGARVVGTRNDLRRRRRLLKSSRDAPGHQTTLDKVRGTRIDISVEEFLRPSGVALGPVAPPIFVRNLANSFIDAQAKRHDADYDMNKPLSELDARLLGTRARRVIADWRAANTSTDRDFKHALCVLVLSSRGSCGPKVRS